MKKTLPFLLLLAMAFACAVVRAQVITRDGRVYEKNIVVGLKGGINALGMQYKVEGVKDSKSFYNPSAIGQDFSNLKGCFKGGVFVERVIPNFSYGLEFLVERTYAKTPKDTIYQASYDSATFASIRVPLKIKFFENKLISPYIFVAPGISTYLSDTIAGKPFNGYSGWNGNQVQWGTRNTISWNFNVVAGVGLQGTVPMGLYEFYVRLEGGYNFGLQNLSPKETKLPERRMKGWEATLGVAFPLFINPSYSWFN